MHQSNETPAGTPAPEIIEVDATRVACDGGCGPLGHPRVWLSIDPGRGFIDCGYCDRRFVLRGVRQPAPPAAEPASEPPAAVRDAAPLAGQ